VAQLGAQAELAQLVLPCGFVQAVAHAPQCATLLLNVTSQPLLTVPSQSAKPAVQLAI
jgi:hypothetical protein